MHLYGICEGKTFAIGRLGYQPKERLVRTVEGVCFFCIILAKVRKAKPQLID